MALLGISFVLTSSKHTQSWEDVVSSYFSVSGSNQQSVSYIYICTYTHIRVVQSCYRIKFPFYFNVCTSCSQYTVSARNSHGFLFDIYIFLIHFLSRSLYHSFSFLDIFILVQVSLSWSSSKLLYFNSHIWSFSTFNSLVISWRSFSHFAYTLQILLSVVLSQKLSIAYLETSLQDRLKIDVL